MHGRGRARTIAAAGASLLALTACTSFSGRGRAPPPDPDLRIWAPGVVHWTGDADRSMRFAIENGTQRTLSVQAPHPAGARVAIYDESGAAPACAVEPADPPPAETVQLAPGDHLPVRVDLGEACGDLRPGEYRYELSYRATDPGGGRSLTLQTRYGTLFVESSRVQGRAGAARGRPLAPRR